MKTIIHVWSQYACNIDTSYSNTQSYWGIGDLLRGTYGLYTYAKKHGHAFIVDISLHPVHEFLESHSHEYTQLVNSRKDSIPFYFFDEIQRVAEMEQLAYGDPRGVLRGT